MKKPTIFVLGYNIKKKKKLFSVLKKKKTPPSIYSNGLYT